MPVGYPVVGRLTSNELKNKSNLFPNKLIVTPAVLGKCPEEHSHFNSPRNE